MNDSISYSDLRSNLKKAFDKVCNEHAPLLVNRRNGEDVVIISKEDFSSLEETAYLLKSPKNARRLLEALYRSKGIEFSTIEALRNELDN
jgi:antitoxin YefM